MLVNEGDDGLSQEDQAAGRRRRDQQGQGQGRFQGAFKEVRSFWAACPETTRAGMADHQGHDLEEADGQTGEQVRRN